MKLLAALAVGILTAVPAAAQTSSALKTDTQKTFYTLGVAVGRNVAQFDLKPSELKYVIMGFRDAALGRRPKADPNIYIKKVNDLLKARQEVKTAAQKTKDSAFLAKARHDKGAQVFPSGLIYIPIKEGTGDSPTASDTVKAGYTGRLTNGKIFDSSSEHGGPIDFPLSGVIPCWTEGIQKMKVGGKARLICPSAIAYGDRGQPPIIPGGAALIFDVDLVGIVKR